MNAPNDFESVLRQQARALARLQRENARRLGALQDSIAASKAAENFGLGTCGLAAISAVLNHFGAPAMAFVGAVASACCLCVSVAQLWRAWHLYRESQR